MRSLKLLIEIIILKEEGGSENYYQISSYIIILIFEKRLKFSNSQKLF